MKGQETDKFNSQLGGKFHYSQHSIYSTHNSTKMVPYLAILQKLSTLKVELQQQRMSELKNIFNIFQPNLTLLRGPHF